jgi:PTH1 family peptidyl-tRNA hydrolase
MQTSFLVVGLGNPGSQYAGNRHNVGFMAADALADALRAGPWSRKFKGKLAEAQAGGERIYLLKPQTYMNLSGESVRAAAQFYKIPPERVIVLYDELDLLPGRLRVKRGGGHGGHNGVKSIDAHLGKDYTRVRIGIGHPGEKHLVTNYVLGDFGKAEREEQDRMISAIRDAFPMLLKGDEAGFMNKVALTLNPPPKSLKNL